MSGLLYFTNLFVQFSTSYPHVTCELPSLIAPRLGGSPICVATCLKLSRFEMKVRKIACAVNFLACTQKSKVKGDSCSDIIELDTQRYCRQKKKFRSYLPSSGKYKVLGLNRDLLTDILTVKTYCMDMLSLFAVEGSLVPAFHVIFAEIFIFLILSQVSCSSWPSL